MISQLNNEVTGKENPELSSDDYQQGKIDIRVESNRVSVFDQLYADKKNESFLWMSYTTIMRLCNREVNEDDIAGIKGVSFQFVATDEGFQLVAWRSNSKMKAFPRYYSIPYEAFACGDNSTSSKKNSLATVNTKHEEFQRKKEEIMTGEFYNRSFSFQRNHLLKLLNISLPNDEDFRITFEIILEVNPPSTDSDNQQSFYKLCATSNDVILTSHYACPPNCYGGGNGGQ